VGGGDAVEQSTPAFAWRSVFSQLLGLNMLAADLPAQQQHVRQQLRGAGEDKDLAPLLNTVLPLSFPETPTTAPVLGAARAEQTSALLLRLLRRMAEAEPLLIVLEDIHWLDPTSWELLHQLLAAQMMLLVVTTRPPELETYEAYAPLLAAPETRWLSLQPLATDELLPLLYARLGATWIAPEVAALILERADGNPYFGVELATLLLELGLVQVEAGMCRFALGRQQEAAVLPDTLQGLIGYRVDCLAPEEQLTIKVASVIGRVFAAQTLQAVHPRSPEPAQLRRELTAVEQLNLVVRELPELEQRYAFRHVIAQEAIYSLLTTELQRSLHWAVARWLEQAYAADLGPYALLLAYHWQRADEPVPARDYLDIAGAQALRDGAYREAREQLEQAAVLEARHPAPAEPKDAAILRQVRRERMLGEANIGLGEPTRALPYLRAALALVDHTPPRSALGLAVGIATQLLRLAAHELRGTPAARSEPENSLVVELAWVYRLYSRIALIDNDALITIYTGCWFTVLAEEAGQPVQRVLASAGANILFTVLFLPGIAAFYKARVDLLAAQPEVAVARGDIENMLASTAIGQAQWQEGFRRLSASIALCRQLQDWRTWGEVTVTLGLAHYFLGAFEPAQAVFQDLAAMGGARGLLEHQAYAHNGLGMVALRQGHDVAALAELERAAELLEQSNELRMAKQMNYGARAVLYARLGRWEEARQMAGRVARATGLLPQTLHHGIDGLIGWAEIALQAQERPSQGRGEPADARRAVAALRRFALFYPMGRPVAWRYRGRLAWAQGKAQTALRAWHRSLAEAQRLEMPYDEGLAHAELGLHLPPADPRRRQHLVRAIAILSRLGARPDLERVIIAVRVG
jgi:tetratricopeptide (TPR) repeat protein